MCVGGTLSRSEIPDDVWLSPSGLWSVRRKQAGFQNAAEMLVYRWCVISVGFLFNRRLFPETSAVMCLVSFQTIPVGVDCVTRGREFWKQNQLFFIPHTHLSKPKKWSRFWFQEKRWWLTTIGHPSPEPWMTVQSRRWSCCQHSGHSVALVLFITAYAFSLHSDSTTSPTTGRRRTFIQFCRLFH